MMQVIAIMTSGAVRWTKEPWITQVPNLDILWKAHGTESYLL